MFNPVTGVQMQTRDGEFGKADQVKKAEKKVSGGTAQHFQDVPDESRGAAGASVEGEPGGHHDP